MFFNEKILKRIKDNKFLIASHRGSSGGNIIENTNYAYQAALLEGADILEIDVVKSTDGVFYCFHDGNEQRLLGESASILTMSSAEINSIHYRNSIFYKNECHVETLENALIFLKNKDCFINLDRSWNYFTELLPYLDRYQMEEKIFIKSPPEKKYLNILKKHTNKYMFMPIVKTLADIEFVQSYEDVNTVGYELIADSETSELFDDIVIDDIHQQGKFVWANAIVLDDKTKLYAGKDDDISIINEPDDGWGVLLHKKFDIIQTDWPAILDRYRKKR